MFIIVVCESKRRAQTLTKELTMSPDFAIGKQACEMISLRILIPLAEMWKSE